MDLIYTNAQREDQGVLHDYEMDMAYGADENDFECTISASSHCCEAGSYLYIEGTEYGGIVDSIQSKSASKEVTYAGRTWHGILGSKVILPLQSDDVAEEGVTVKDADSVGNSMVGRYLIISGDVHACLRFLIKRIGLADLFTVPELASGYTIAQYQFYRYTDAYSGIIRMLDSIGLKLKVAYTNGMAVLTAAEKYDYSQDEEFDSDLVEFDVTKSYKTVNHLICLGAGELENRLVVHLYADAEGNVSQTQTQFGMDEYTAIYEYSSVESEEELIKEGTEQLKAQFKQEKLTVDFDESMDNYDVGDIVGTMDNVTKTRISATVTKKIISIKNGKVNIDISTDSEHTGSLLEGGGSSSEVIAVDSAKLGGKEPKYYIQPRNLLDNSDFRNPVNQRGQTRYAVSWAYTIDRWICNNAELGVSYDENGLTLDLSAGTTQRRLYQKSALAPGRYTFAACVGDVISTVVFTYSGTAISNAVETSNTPNFKVYAGIDGEYIAVSLQVIAGAVITGIKWAALYEGEYTADNLPPYVPKEAPIEKANCGYRFARFGSDTYTPIGMAQANETGALCCVIPLPYPINMDAAPTITLEGAIWARSANAYVEASGIMLNSYGEYQISIWVQGSNFEAGKAYDVFLSPGSYLSISRDL